MYSLTRLALGCGERGVKDLRIGFTTGKIAAHKYVTKKRGDPGRGDFSPLHTRRTICEETERESCGQILQQWNNIFIQATMLQAVVPVDVGGVTLNAGVMN